MIVKERLNDVHDQLQEYRTMNNSSLVERYPILAYAEERFFTTLSWMQFFDMEGKHFIVDEEKLKNMCVQKISEAEERSQYTSLFLGPLRLEGIQEKIDTSHRSLNQREYFLCIITASQAKADANAILSSLGVAEKSIQDFVKGKRNAVERVIAENSEEGIFPILGYSYYQYAHSLQEREPYTALAYLEYALEMSDIAIYFPEEKSFFQETTHLIHNKDLILLGEGILIGILATMLVIKMKMGLVAKRKSKK